MDWLNRELILSPYFYCLCLCPKQFKRELKRLGIEREVPFEIEGTDATCHTFNSLENKRSCCIITLSLQQTQTRSKQEVYALLVHEAVHLWQYIKEYIGEDCPSKEFESYSVQTICQRLFESYEHQINKTKNKPAKIKTTKTIKIIDTIPAKETIKRNTITGDNNEPKP